ncbi:3-oxoacyl-ACP reductase [Litorivivens sp.]|uniref:3-oxoacyl-ACP reductase n=1 Tax=Litorivivens sp. TaxID=2020868 RepID=UPI003566502C
MSQIVETLINLGLGKPAELKRATTPFQGTVLLGSGPNPGCMNALSLFCQQHGLAVAAPDNASGEISKTLEAAKIWAHGDDAPGEKLQALVFDGTGISTTAELSLAYEFFQPALKSVARSGRLLIVSRPHRDQSDPERAACQRALEGLARSLAKESGKKGITAQTLCVEDGAEENLTGPLTFLLSHKSAYVNAQVFRVSEATATSAAIDTQPLAGKTALVTGASRGIGAAIASTLARDGAKIIGLDVEPMRADLETLMQKLGGEALVADITADGTPGQLLELAKTKGGFDIVVHNAGITRDKTLANMPKHWWDMTLEINLGAALRINKALLEANAINEGGRIIGVSSMNGIAGQRGQSNYAASKAGVIGYVEQMAPQLKDRGITVNAVAPGFIETAMTAAIPTMTREVGRRLNSLSQGGQPEDVAETIAFFANPASQGITGNVIRVCGQSWLGA